MSNIRLACFNLLMMLGMAYVVYRSLNKLPTYTVSIDDDGIWQGHLSKEGNIVSWDQIYSSRHATAFFKCFYLLDGDRKKLFTVHYQLENYEMLVQIIRFRGGVEVGEQARSH
ncbi:hypothetical protein L4C34_01025 [Vibrio profundum]|uniref:hypothetical protein n=1 Tax=Vibrio profundum TaxID=2910247 RepID=UPI003D0D28C0